MITLLVLAALAAAELLPRVVRLNGRWETPPMEMRRRMRALQRGVRGVMLSALTLAVTASGRAQSFDWTLAPDPGFPCAACAAFSGSGVFTASPSLFSNIQGNGYPITSLTGTLNGAAVTLGRAPSTGGLSNLYYAPSLPVPWFAPLYLSTSAGTLTLSQSDVPQPGTGQLLARSGGGAASPVSFTVTPYVAPTPTPPPTAPAPASRGIGMGHVVFQRPTAAAIAPRRAPIAIEVSVPAAVALVVGVYEWHEHRHHERRDAYYAGRG